MSRDGTCYIVGAGTFYDRGFAPGAEDFVIAADGGYRTLLERGTPMDLVVGDFDSMGVRPDHPKVVDLPVEKDDTDTMAAIRLGWDRGYRTFRLYGGTGGRVDHTLANLQSLVWLSVRGGRGFLVGEDWTAAAITDGSLAFSADHRGTLSVFCQGDLEGLKYSLKNAVLTCDFPLGVSNSFAGAESRVTVGKGTLLVIWYH